MSENIDKDRKYQARKQILFNACVELFFEELFFEKDHPPIEKLSYKTLIAIFRVSLAKESNTINKLNILF